MDDGLRWLSLPARTASLGQFTEFVRVGAREAALPEARLGPLELVLEEVLMNVFSYAYPAGESGAVAVGYEAAAPDRLRVQIRDSGRAYDPLAAEDPDLTLGLDDRPIGGLGLFLIREMTDSIEYQRSGGQNILTFLIQY
jgi:anti-sigma regulatory factor (Ser/Thr protein kinase)